MFRSYIYVLFLEKLKLSKATLHCPIRQISYSNSISKKTTFVVSYSCKIKQSHPHLSTLKMVSNSHYHLFVLAFTLIYLLFIPMINCMNIQNKETAIDKQQQRQQSIIQHYVSELLKQEQLNSDEYEQLKHFIANYFKNSPYRRASSFHAMRGK